MRRDSINFNVKFKPAINLINDITNYNLTYESNIVKLIQLDSDEKSTFSDMHN